MKTHCFFLSMPLLSPTIHHLPPIASNAALYQKPSGNWSIFTRTSSEIPNEFVKFVESIWGAKGSFRFSWVRCRKYQDYFCFLKVGKPSGPHIYIPRKVLNFLLLKSFFVLHEWDCVCVCVFWNSYIWLWLTKMVVPIAIGLRWVREMVLSFFLREWWIVGAFGALKKEIMKVNALEGMLHESMVLQAFYRDLLQFLCESTVSLIIVFPFCFNAVSWIIKIELFLITSLLLQQIYSQC